MSDEASDDDWFERAIESDGEDEDEDDDGGPDAGAAEESERPASAEESSDGAQFDDGAGRDDAVAGDEAFDADADDADPFDSDDDPFGGDADPFESDDDPFGDGDPFGDEGAAGDDVAGEETDDDDSLFEDDFAEAFQSAPGPGGGGGGGGGGSDFEEEDFDSDIPRIDLGIEGLDAMIQGGVPERHLIVAIGSAGTGKTTFGLQFLDHGLRRGESAVFITLEQSHDAIVDTATEHGWEFDRYEAEDRLAVVDLDPVEMANSLDNIRGELPALIERFDADRLVLDSVSLLEMMYDDQARRRTEVFDFTRSLKRAGVTTMLTSEASESNPYASRHGIIEYLTDAVFVLQYVRDETSETRLAVEIQKIRDANHSRETKPYEITTGGISVYSRANIF